MALCNIPEGKLGIVSVSRDCFPIVLSASCRGAVTAAYGPEIFSAAEGDGDLINGRGDAFCGMFN